MLENKCFDEVKDTHQALMLKAVMQTKNACMVIQPEIGKAQDKIEKEIKNKYGKGLAQSSAMFHSKQASYSAELIVFSLALSLSVVPFPPPKDSTEDQIDALTHLVLAGAATFMKKNLEFLVKESLSKVDAKNSAAFDLTRETLLSKEAKRCNLS